MTDLVPDISDCDREPIHIPGSIQPHGCMLIAESRSLVIRYGGGDVGRMLKTDAWIDRPLADIVGEDNAHKAARVVQITPKKAFVGTIETPNAAGLDITAHVSGNYLVLEIEPKTGPAKSSGELLSFLEIASGAFDRATTLKSLCEVAAVEFRKLTGYDRVMVYRFLDDGAGTVLAEDRRSDLHSFLNHHFPGSDIPQQARALYVRNLLRVIPDVNYTEVCAANRDSIESLQEVRLQMLL